MGYERIVFDLDGTLIDSAPDLHRCVNLLLRDAGAAPLNLTQVKRFIGNGVPKLVERVARAAEIAFSSDLVARFEELYGAEPVVLTAPYPNAEAALDRLAEMRCRLSIATNKPEAPTRAILERFGWTDRFDIVVGGDTLPVRKPDPAPLRRAMGGHAPEDVLFVGDSDVDAETAPGAGVAFALFTEGYRRSPVAELPHHHAFSDFAELAGIAATGRRG